MKTTIGIWLALSSSLIGCGGAATCSTTDSTSCKDGQVCEDVGGQPTCSAPLVIRGKVTDPANAAIEAALVTALDVNDAPFTGTAKSAAMTGAYELTVPAPRAAGGAVMPRQVKLRGTAAGFETFPSGIRRSLPIELSTATMKDGKWVVESAATVVVLPPVMNAGGLGSISGKVKAGAGKSGALVVAEGAATLTGIADTDGVYQIFNVPAGMYTVKGYAAGLQLVPAMPTVAAGEKKVDVDLAVAMTPLGSVSGSANIVNGGGGSATSVVLVVESTFNDVLKRGEVPPGLRAPKAGAPSVSGAFTIADVPDGKYVVLAAFENDLLVRDPDTSIGGTQIQHITVAGAALPLPAAFKVTGALAVVSPGANDVPDEVTGTPNFVWADDSSEDQYTIEVFDTRGTKVWENLNLPGASGGGNVMVMYGGPALTQGGYYQFRVTSLKKGVPISQTEDLRGVFIAK